MSMLSRRKGASTTHTDFPAHPPARRRPSIGIATAGGCLHVVLPGGDLPLPATGAVDLTTTHDGQREMQLLVVEGGHWDAARNRLLAELAVGGLPPGARRGDVRLQLRFLLDEQGWLEVEAECAECVPRRRAWCIDTAAAAATPCC